MRKTLALFLTFIIMLLSLYCSVFTVTNKEKDNVIITNVFSYGEKSAADRVALNFKSLYKENILWDITYKLKDNSVNTDFTFYKNRIPREYESYKGIQLHTSFLQSVVGPHGLDYYNGLEKAYQELIESAEPNVEVSKVIYLSDYMEYYPINIEISFPGKNIDSSSRHSSFDPSDEALFQALREFFRIPIIENHKVKLSATVGEDGTLYSSGTAKGSGLGENEDDYGFYADSIITDKECIIFFDNKTELSKSVDTSLIPGGYGIYRLPYTEKDGTTVFNIKRLKNVYPINNEYTIYDIDLSEDGKYLYLITKEDDKSVFTVIDPENFEAKERTILTEDKNESCYLEYTETDFLVFNIYHPSRESKIAVFTFDGNDKPVREITVDKYLEIQEGDTTRYIGADVYKNTQIKAVWDNGKLYVANPFDNTTNSYIKQNGFRIAVYGKEGMEYYGEYITSLSAGNDGYHSSSYHIYFSRDDEINITLN